MKYLALILVHFLGCSRPFYYVDYREPAGEFSVKVPWGWALEEHGRFSRRPYAEVTWLGKLVDSHEGIPIGVMLSIKRLDRNPGPGYRKDFAAAEAELFSGKPVPGATITTGTASGFPARWVSNDDWAQYKGDGLFHGPVKKFPSRLRAFVIRTPEAYYVLDYKAVNEHFDSHKPAFDTLVASFKLKP